VSASDSPQAAYAVGVHTRQPGGEVAVAGSPALLYAEWARLDTEEAGSGQVRSLEDDGFLVEVDETLALRDVTVDSSGNATDVSECRAEGSCQLISEALVPDSECEPADGCATVDSNSGALRAVHVATLLNRRPAIFHMYQLRSEREVTGIFDPTRAAKWDGMSDYLLISFDELPPAYSTLTLTVSYADGGTDQLIMNFEIPLPGAATTTTAA
jgi:hypothetical protein